jgi:hypothetical protein
MKKLITLTLVLIITGNSFAQAPQKISYQCVVRDANGVLVTNRSIGIKISILQGTSTGAVVYQEIFSPDPQTNSNGLLSIEIGGGIPVSGTFAGIYWSGGSYFIKTEIDPTGHTNYTITGTSQILSVPYSLYAKTAGNGSLWSPSGSDIYFENGNVGIGTYAPAGLLNIYGNSNTGLPQLLLSESEGDFARLSFKNTAATTKNWSIAGGLHPIDANSRLNFWYWNGTAGADLMSITGNGNIGIGTSTPEASLQILGNSNMNSPQLLLSESEDDYARLTFKNTTTNTKHWAIAGRPDPGDANSRLNFWYWNGTTGANLVSITGDGKVGIGTSTPNATLDVAGTVKIGSSGRVISEIIEITGTTIDSFHGTLVPFPSGYTWDNTRVLSCEVKKWGSRWLTMGASAESGGDFIQCELWEMGVWIICGDDDIWHNKPFRLLLMKVQ